MAIIPQIQLFKDKLKGFIPLVPETIRELLPLPWALQKKQEEYTENKESSIPFIENLKQQLFINK